MKPKALILDGYGLNCGYETKYSFEKAGAEADRVHINELLEEKKSLKDYHILAFIGGFSWGDDHGAGTLEACKLKYNVGEDIENFVKEDKLVIGICNGFQALVNFGLLPGFDGNYHSREVALLPNDCGNFRDDWVNLKVKKSPCVFTKDIEKMDLPIRHAEGKFYAEDDVIDELFENNQVVMQYVEGTLTKSDFPYNPNGSKKDIAGICDPTGKIFGLMPHPEAYNSFLNHPNWTKNKEIYKRKGGTMPEEGDGIQILRNGVKYIKEEFL
ncbi:MAG: phosphoribosylformylglycinamidine synthase I [Candidatus Aenigmarchaeota archaeon]|nr:phosphoribosylformylglycinamidine synthase I [Candidatus Aenigmarchaeota archaeon]